LVLDQDLFDVGVSEGCFGVEQDGEHGDADFGFSQSALADSAGGGMSAGRAEQRCCGEAGFGLCV
jgi:hypothetical protein